ncbi:MAG: cell division protein FtsZ [Gammaproteobacteria bacterium CG22_combo_CG10-13_8_21_14_all_40_8]|nr:MAG: cell division protein FtsZ [Gammaproteobacteria bacterium CG22_combo_CG10-13_8_21_14_all_40_8]
MSNSLFKFEDSPLTQARIKVIGVGGGGGNAIEHMLDVNIDKVDFICANTDAQALSASSAKTTIQLGNSITKGLGAGANPEVGKQAALEDREKLEEVLKDTDMVFITAGMGGGTGTGAAPIVAEIARSLGILTVAVVTKPFFFEMKKRMTVAEAGIEELRKHVDSLIIVPNDKLLENLKGAKLREAFRVANGVLHGAVQGIAELITNPGLINVDFADVRTVMSEKGMAMMGSGIGKGENRAREAAELAIASPFLEDVDLSGARGILINITAGEDLGLDEYAEVGNIVSEFASEEATVVIGTSIDPNLTDELRVTVVATGLGRAQELRQTASVELQEPVHLVTRVANVKAEPDYQNLDTPTIIRRQNPGKNKVDTDMDYLDIPAFLRRQNN